MKYLQNKEITYLLKNKLKSCQFGDLKKGREHL